MAPTLLFLPDISGFTKFVNSTEIEHSRHIIAELLEVVIDSDDLGLTVAEIEGDAVFFYREGALPTRGRIAEQARRMFEAFHGHLRSYGTHRICDCGACSTAEGLTLKIVVHAGPVGHIDVRGFRKPHGPDVIVAHRLLKNDVDGDEYLLVTGSVGGDDEEAPWSEWRSGESFVDEVGAVPYQWLSLAPLRATIPDPPAPKAFVRSSRPWTTEIYIDRDPDSLYELITNLDRRLLWNPAVAEIDFERGRVNRSGTRHRCLVDGRLIDFETVSGDFGPRSRAYGEYVVSNPLVLDHVNYFVVDPEGDGSRVRFEAHYRPRAFPLSVLAPLVRLQLRRVIPQVMEALKQAAETESGERVPEHLAAAAG